MPNGVSLYARWLLLRVFGVGQSEGSEPSSLRKLRPYERSRCTEHGVRGNSALGKEYARPTGGRHGRTTDAPEQRFNGANLRETLEVGYEKHGHARSGVSKAWPRAL
jgi:hypothetical protein